MYQCPVLACRMVYIWAVEALGKGPSEPKTQRSVPYSMSVAENEVVIQNKSDDVNESEEENEILLFQTAV